MREADQTAIEVLKNVGVTKLATAHYMRGLQLPERHCWHPGLGRGDRFDTARLA